MSQMVGLKKILPILGGGSWSPIRLNPTIYYDNGADYMAADGSAWTDRILGLNMAASGTGQSRATGINGRLKLVNTVAGYWTRARITQMQNLAGLTIWGVGAVAQFEQFLAGGIYRTGLVHDISGAGTEYAMLSNGTATYGYVTSNNNPHYKILVFDGTQATNALKLKLYIDGVQQSLTFVLTIPITTENNAGSAPQIGRGGLTNRASDNYEFGVINRAITTDEIALLNGFLANRYAL